MARVSAVIPTFNRASALKAVWPSYLAQGLREVIVVNDGSTDATDEILAELRALATVPVQVVRHHGRRGLPTARMTGVKAATGDWVLFGEDDVWLGENYVTTLLAEGESRGAEVLAGRIVNLRVETSVQADALAEADAALAHPVDASFDARRFKASFDAIAPYSVRAPFLHAVCLVRRRVFERVAFDSCFGGTAFREETDFQLGAREAGFGLAFVPGATCYHLRGPLAQSGGLRPALGWAAIEYWGARNTLRLVRKHWAFLKAEHGYSGSPISYMLFDYLPFRAHRLALAVRRTTGGAREPRVA